MSTIQKRVKRFLKLKHRFHHLTFNQMKSNVHEWKIDQYEEEEEGEETKPNEKETDSKYLSFSSFSFMYLFFLKV